MAVCYGEMGSALIFGSVAVVESRGFANNRIMRSMHATNPELDLFCFSKVLPTAVKFGVLAKLGDRRITGSESGGELGLHPRGFSGFFDLLVAMQFLDREGDGRLGERFHDAQQECR